MKKLIAILLISVLTPSCCFGAFFKKKDVDIDGNEGYVGKLPDITKEYEQSEVEVAPPIYDKTQDFHSGNAIKPIPRDDPSFVNIILKKEKTSEYVNDLQEFIEMLEKIYDSIEDKEDVQRFASRVYYLNANADYLKEKYSNKPESGFVSFKQIMKASDEAKEVLRIRSEAEKYKKYLAYTDTGYEYSKNNIDMQLFNLQLSLEKTINLLKNTH